MNKNVYLILSAIPLKSGRHVGKNLISLIELDENEVESKRESHSELSKKLKRFYKIVGKYDQEHPVPKRGKKSKEEFYEEYYKWEFCSRGFSRLIYQGLNLQELALKFYQGHHSYYAIYLRNDVKAGDVWDSLDGEGIVSHWSGES